MKLLSTLLSLLLLSACQAPQTESVALPASDSGLERVLILAKGME